MANVYSGIYTKLKDRNCVIKDRLKLAKFAWFSDNVIFPNKEQVLIDFLSGLLLNKKRSNLSENETGLVWRCLYEILQSKKCHIPGRSRQTLIIKPSICQVLCNSILLECDKKSGCIADIVGCSLAIIQSPTLSYVFTSKYDFLVKFLCNVLLLIIRTIQDGRVVPSEYAQLLQKCTSAYSVSQRAQPQQEKVFQSVVDCLLVPIILLENDGVPRCPELKDCAARLGHVLDQALFHKEHHPFYESFLSIVAGKDEGKHKISKTIESLFKLFSSLINKQELQESNRDHQKLASHYLTVFFEHFLSYKCHGDKPLTAFHLFVHICSLLGVKDTEKCEMRLSAEDTIAVVSSLLRSLLKHDIYSQPQDAMDGNIQLKFYSHILVVVLQYKQSPLFYSCLESLLELNHVILETKMELLLQVAWFDVPIQEQLAKDCRIGPLESFVTRLFQTYSRLRQIPKILALLFTSLKESQQNGESSPHQNPVFSDKISLEFGEIVESLPQAVAIDVWRLFLKEFQDFLPELGQKVHKFFFVAKVFSVYLSHVKVADYTVTHLTRSKVKDLMADTQSKVLTPLVEFIVTEKVDAGEPLVFSTFLLCFSWGELHLLLGEFYPGNERSQCHDPNLYRQLESIYNISSKTWKKLHTIATTKGHKRDFYLWKLLTTLILKANLADKEMPVSNEECVGRILERLFSDIDRSLSAEESTIPCVLWNICDENYSLASLDLVLKFIPLCGFLAMPDTTQHITNLVVQVIINEEAKKGCGVQKYLLKKCSHSALLECGNWTACMMTSVFQSLQSTVPSKQKNPSKKMKSDSSNLACEAVLDIVCDSIFTSAEDSQKTEKLKDLSCLINDRLLKVDKESHLGVNTSTLMACLQIMEILVQTDPTPEEKIRGFMGTLSLLTQGISGEQKDWEVILDKIVTLLIQMVERVGQIPLFQGINMDSYMSWFDCTIASKKKTGSWKFVRKLELLLELSCRVMVTEFELLPELLKTITKALQNSKEVPCSVVVSLKEISQLLKRSYVKEDVISLCQTDILQLFHHMLSHLNPGASTTRRFSTSLIRALSAIVNILPTDQLQQECVGNVCDFCLEVLQNSKGDDELTSASLEYLESVCLCRDTKNDFLSPDVNLTLWKTLKKVFRDFFVHGKQRPSKERETEFGHKVASNAGKQQMEEVQYFQEDPMVLSLQDREKEHSWNWMRKKMIFEGCLETDGKKLIFKQVQSTIGALIFSLDANLFQMVIETLLIDCSIMELAETDFCRMLASLQLWSQVIQNELSEEKGAVVVQAVEEIIVNLQSAMIQLKDIKEDKVVLHLMLPLLNCQAEMLELGPSLMSSQCAAVALQSCGCIPSYILSNFPAFSAVCAVLTSLMIHHTETVLKVIPTFVSCVNRTVASVSNVVQYGPRVCICFCIIGFDLQSLMSSVISFGNQETLSDADRISDAKQCAHLLNKLYVLMASHKQEFSKVAVYMTANYVTEVQRVTLHPVVKRALLPAVYAVLDICDTHAVSQLHMVLNQGVKEVFKMLYADYMKYHHYTGKV